MKDKNFIPLSTKKPFKKSARPILPAPPQQIKSAGRLQFLESLDKEIEEVNIKSFNVFGGNPAPPRVATKAIIYNNKQKNTNMNENDNEDFISEDLNDFESKRKIKDIKCAISGVIIPPEKLHYTFIANQRNGRNEYVSEECLKYLNTCLSCRNLFKETLEEGFCLSCIHNAKDRVILSYNTKAESKKRAFLTKADSDEQKIKFQDKNISEIYGENHPKSFIFHPGSGNIHLNLFGIELEYETKNQGIGALKVNNLVKDFAILKRDSTLRHGFEVVSAPADKQFHYHCWDQLFSSIENDENIICTPFSFDPELGKGVGCGLHIHVSKDSMVHHNSYQMKDKNLDIVTGMAVAKLQTFIYSKNNRKFVEIMAGRKSNMYNNFTHKKGIEILDGKCIGGAKKVIEIGYGNGPGDNAGHRTAINFNSSNGKTIEFRIFRSTKNRAELLKNIDFVDAICCFCRTGNASLSEMNNWIHFVEWVEKNRQDYRYLFKFFCEDKSFLEIRKRKEEGIEEKIEEEEVPIHEANRNRPRGDRVHISLDRVVNAVPADCFDDYITPAPIEENHTVEKTNNCLAVTPLDEVKTKLSLENLRGRISSSNKYTVLPNKYYKWDTEGVRTFHSSNYEKIKTDFIETTEEEKKEELEVPPTVKKSNETF